MAQGPSIAVEEEGSFDEYTTRGGQLCGFDLNLSYSSWVTLDIYSPKRSRMLESANRSDQGEPHQSDGFLNEEIPQDADYSSLSYELENLIFARFPRSEYWKLCFLNRRCLSLLKSGELYRIRREIGFSEPSVFMCGAGQRTWWAFDNEFKSCRKLPDLPSDHCFANGDKESVSAGTDLLVSGKEVEGLVIWRYELVKNKWYKGPSMITPRCLFASATSGSCAYVAGGMASGVDGGVFNTAEKYNSESGSWVQLPRMMKRRYMCAGCYMDNKFYVIGGRNEEGELTCGEFLDESKNRWELIPDILRDDEVRSSAPPLVAVVNNELYSLEACTNQLKVYSKKRKTWKVLGQVPVRADWHNGWGVAFKSMGKQLVVIGGSGEGNNTSTMSIYTCCPQPEDDSRQVEWTPLVLQGAATNCLSHFILNCCVMVA